MQDPIQMIISYKGEVVFVNVPQDDTSHLVTIYCGPEGEDLFMDGAPVDPESGDRILLEPTSAVLKAADRMAQLWSESGWKLSTNRQKIEKAVNTYMKARADMVEGGEQPPETEVSEPAPTEPNPAPETETV
jgi:hypothetical protein